MMNFDHAKKISTLESIRDLNSMLDIQTMFIYQVSQLRSMGVTRRIVLTLHTKVLYKFGCFKENVWSFLKRI